MQRRHWLVLYCLCVYVQYLISAALVRSRRQQSYFVVVVDTQRGGLYGRSDAEQSDGDKRGCRVLAAAGQAAKFVQNRHHLLSVRRSEMWTQVRIVDLRRFSGGFHLRTR